MAEEKAMQEIRFEVRDVRPAEASVWLTRARNKVKLDRCTISTYARDMQADVWKLNGEPIIFSRAGQLLTGRSRLAACVEAGRPFASLLVHNVDEKHFETIDAVRRRTVGDILTIRKELDGRALAAALTALWRYANDDVMNVKRRVSASQLLGILQENPEIRTSLRLTHDVRKIMSHGVACALHFLFSRVNSETANRFFQELLEVPAEAHPAPALLRRQLEEIARHGGRKSQAFVIGLSIKAWEAYAAGKQMSLLRYSIEKEDFPQISGLPADLSLDGVVRAKSTAQGSTAPSSSASIQVRIEQITPERASEILSRNEGNRRIASAVLDKYARDMQAGNWALNGQTIKLGKSGRLLDGQHRCAAAIKAGRGFDAIVVEGLDDNVFDTFDLGARRAIGDILIDRHEQNTSTLAATLRQLWLLNNGLLQYRAVSPTVSELLDTLDRHPAIRDSVRLSGRIRDVIAPSIGCALHYLFSRVDRAKADEFTFPLGDGLHLNDMGNPIWKVRKRLQDDRASRKREMSDAEKAAIVIKAWNAFFRGESVGALKWQNAGPRKEDFPQIAGLQTSLRQNHVPKAA
jgi:hypothetical protein